MPNSSDHKGNAMRGVSVQTVITIVAGVIEIVTFSVLSRLLSKTDFGYFASISAVTAIFASLADAGVGAAIVQRKNPSAQFVNNAFSISLVLGSAMMVLLVVLSGPISVAVADATMHVPLMLIAATLLLNCLSSVNISIMHRNMQFLRVGVVSVSALVVSSATAIVLAAKGLGFYAILAKVMLFSFMQWLLSAIAARHRFRITFRRDTTREIWHYSGWLMASGVFRNLSHQVDRLLMPRLLSVEMLGAYNRPKDFVYQITSKVNSIFDTVLFPVISKLQDSREALRRAFAKSFYTINLGSTALAIVFVVNAELIVRIFLGEQWLHLTPLLQIFSVATIVNADGRMADVMLRSMGKTRVQFVFRVVETVVKVSAVAVSARWGITGVALTYVSADLVLHVVKIGYVGYLVSLPKVELVRVLLQSWRFMICVAPVLVVAYAFIPDTIAGGILLAVATGVMLVVIFLLFPSAIGPLYRQELYPQVEKIFDKLIVKLRREE